MPSYLQTVKSNAHNAELILGSYFTKRFIRICAEAYIDYRQVEMNGEGYENYFISAFFPCLEALDNVLCHQSSMNENYTRLLRYLESLPADFDMENKTLRTLSMRTLTLHILYEIADHMEREERTIEIFY